MFQLSNVVNKNLMEDLIFIVRYVPHTLHIIATHCVFGAVLGWATSFGFKESWNSFTRNNHTAIDPTRAYVPDDEEFLAFSRNSVFNKETPAIREVVPVYAAVVGAVSGGFFATQKVVREIGFALKNDREIRCLNLV